MYKRQDQDGNVLINEYCKPKSISTWEEAEAIHKILSLIHIYKKLILSLLLYINKYYENRIIKVKYFSSLLAITDTTVSRELKKLEELGYIKSELAAHKNISLGKR